MSSKIILTYRKMFQAGLSSVRAASANIGCFVSELLKQKQNVHAHSVNIVTVFSEYDLCVQSIADTRGSAVV